MPFYVLTSWLCSLTCLSCGDVICGNLCLCSLCYLSCGNVICGTSIIRLATYTIIGTARTIIGISNGSILPFVIFFALTSMFFCSLFILQLEVAPSSTMFFLLSALIRESTTTFFLFSNVVYISSLVLLTSTCGFCGLTF